MAKFYDFFQKCSNNILEQHYTKIDYDVDVSKEFDPSSIESFKILYQQCFSLHLSSNLYPVTIDNIQPSVGRAREIYDNEQITNLFLTSYLRYPNIEAYSYNQHNQKYLPKKNIDRHNLKNEFLSDLASPGKIIFLTGNVGEGKSSLLHKFHIETSVTEDEDGWTYFPVLVDVQKILRKAKSIVDTNLFYSLILERFIIEIEKRYKLPEMEKDITENKQAGKHTLSLSAKLSLKAIIASFNASSTLDSIETNKYTSTTESIRRFDTPLAKITHLAEKLNDNKVRMILMVDNLDTFSYSDERYMLFSKGFEKFQSNVFKAKDIVNEILTNLDESHISYIFTLRPYVLSHIFDPSTENHLDNTISAKTNIYKIKFDYQNNSKYIFLSRLKLIYDLCELIQNNENIPKTKKENIQEISNQYLQKIDSIEKQHRSSIAKVFSDFYDITNQGYRSIVLFYKNLEYNPNLLERYFTHDVLHLYKLDFFQQYCQMLPSEYSTTQKNYHYPNIFLVVCNAECNQNATDDIACHPNKFTYCHTRC